MILGIAVVRNLITVLVVGVTVLVDKVVTRPVVAILRVSSLVIPVLTIIAVVVVVPISVGIPVVSLSISVLASATVAV